MIDKKEQEMKWLKDIVIMLASICIILTTIVNMYIVINVYVNIGRLTAVSQSVEKAIKVLER